ncbi:hypothetical protein [Nonomuraea antri]|uniref:hypothetical protein n=1 Tax=Nonomuraea antri TaxID=2730852 RepID=UPI001F1F94C9|nr:hypothetical protein [Nonomuraea antri]
MTAASRDDAAPRTSGSRATTTTTGWAAARQAAAGRASAVDADQLAHVQARSGGPLPLGAGAQAPAGMLRLTRPDSTGSALPVWPDGVTPSLLEEYQVAPVPVERSGETRRVLAAVLKCCWSDLSTDPWPGSPAPVELVLDTYRALIGRTDDLMRNWAVGALRRLHDSAWVVMDDGLVSLGPRCALWPVESYAQLQELVRRLPEPERRKLTVVADSDIVEAARPASPLPSAGGRAEAGTSEFEDLLGAYDERRRAELVAAFMVVEHAAEPAPEARFAALRDPALRHTLAEMLGRRGRTLVQHRERWISGYADDVATALAATERTPASHRAQTAPTEGTPNDESPGNIALAEGTPNDESPGNIALAEGTPDGERPVEPASAERRSGDEAPGAIASVNGPAGATPGAKAVAGVTAGGQTAGVASDVQTAGVTSDGEAASVTSGAGAGGIASDVEATGATPPTETTDGATHSIEATNPPEPASTPASATTPVHAGGQRRAAAVRTSAVLAAELGVAERAVLTLVLVHSVAIPRAEGLLPEDTWLSPHPTPADELRRHTQLPIGELESALRMLRHAGLLSQVKAGEEAGGYVPGPQFHRLTPAARRRLQEELILAAGPHTPLAAAIRARRSAG